MTRIIDKNRDLTIMAYLKEHTYLQTQEEFGISAVQVSRIKKRCEAQEPLTPASPSETQIQSPGLPGPPKNEIPLKPEDLPSVISKTNSIPEIKPLNKEKREGSPASEEIELGKITIIKLMSIYEQLTGKSAPRTKGTTKNTIRDSIISILNREPI